MSVLSLGFILLAGMFAAKLIRRIKIPIVTAYLLLGILIGPSLLNMVSRGILDASALITNVALGFIAFSLGQNFSRAQFKKIGKQVLYISLGEVIGAWLLVTLVIWLILKQPFYVALLFGAIAPATAPAAILMVVREYKARGSFTDTLLGVVAIDDAWGIILFAFCLAASRALAIHVTSNFFVFKFIFRALLEITGAFLLGGVLGWVWAYFSRYATTQSEILIYTLGIILLNTGLAIYFQLSVLLANMFLGTVLVNVHKLSFKFFDTLRSIDSPLYLIFFILAGANLEVSSLKNIGLLGVAYVFTRLPGEMIGAAVGAHMAHASTRIKRYIGWGLAPQAGVAVGLALVAKDAFSHVGIIVFNTILVTTVIYELIGPLATKFALKGAGEI
jgi:NhaP-type Na+/H+ or K+/H+ antiporter